MRFFDIRNQRWIVKLSKVLFKNLINFGPLILITLNEWWHCCHNQILFLKATQTNLSNLSRGICRLLLSGSAKGKRVENLLCLSPIVRQALLAPRETYDFCEDEKWGLYANIGWENDDFRNRLRSWLLHVTSHTISDFLVRRRLRNSSIQIYAYHTFNLYFLSK